MRPVYRVWSSLFTPTQVETRGFPGEIRNRREIQDGVGQGPTEVAGAGRTRTRGHPPRGYRDGHFLGRTSPGSPLTPLTPPRRIWVNERGYSDRDYPLGKNNSKLQK